MLMTVLEIAGSLKALNFYKMNRKLRYFKDFGRCSKGWSWIYKFSKNQAILL